VSLGEVLVHRKEFIQISDFETYKRCRVQLHAKGIVLRDVISGAEIKTKEQQLCRAGEFLVAEIDAKVGGFGVVPDELDGSIVSSHYFLYQLSEQKLERRFLDYFVQTPFFRDQVAARGSTNYAAIRPHHVLQYQIPLPPLPEQRRIVARIESLAAQIHEARSLREQARKEMHSLVTSIHLHLAGTRKKKLGELLKLDEAQVPVTPAEDYPQVGVKGFGGGLFSKPAVNGADTTYTAFNRLYDGTLVLSQVKGWEGAVAVASSDFAGWYVSPEYRTFRCVPSEARPGYLSHLVRTEWFWSRLKNATRGVGARRERTRPEQFLELEIPMPTVEKQAQAELIFAKINLLNELQVDTATEFDELMPSLIAKALAGRL
jgi:type I restriction enzyme S subunit